MRGSRSKQLGLAVLAAAAVLSGCSTTGTPGIKVEKVEVPVIQVQHCVETKDIPAKPAALGAKKMPTLLEDQVRVALAKIGEWTKYGNSTDPILRGCASAVVDVTQKAKSSK